jgi:DNA-binding response OmpR family regulator
MAIATESSKCDEAARRVPSSVTVTFTIPACSEERKLMPKTILIVEDDSELRRGLAIRLKAAGYGVITAADGYSAVATASTQRPDLVLLDLGLPCGDGFSVLERFRLLTPLSTIPVIVLTGRDPSEAEPAARGYEIADFLRKPVDNDVLLKAVISALDEEASDLPQPAFQSRSLELRFGCGASRGRQIGRDVLDLVTGTGPIGG